MCLGALRGRHVVLVLYPGDDTPVCRKQLCAFRDRWDLARNSHTPIFGLKRARRPQPRAPSHARFREKHAFPFPLLVDRGMKVAALYRAGGLFVRRTVYLIGPDGTILYARRGNPAPEDVLAAAQALSGLSRL